MGVPSRINLGLFCVHFFDETRKTNGQRDCVLSVANILMRGRVWGFGARPAGVCSRARPAPKVLP